MHIFKQFHQATHCNHSGCDRTLAIDVTVTVSNLQQQFTTEFCLATKRAKGEEPRGRSQGFLNISQTWNFTVKKKRSEIHSSMLLQSAIIMVASQVQMWGKPLIMQNLMYVQVNEVMSCNVSICALPKKISWLTMFPLWKVWPKEVQLCFLDWSWWWWWQSYSTKYFISGRKNQLFQFLLLSGMENTEFTQLLYIKYYLLRWLQTTDWDGIVSGTVRI